MKLSHKRAEAAVSIATLIMLIATIVLNIVLSPDDIPVGNIAIASVFVLLVLTSLFLLLVKNSRASKSSVLNALVTLFASVGITGFDVIALTDIFEYRSLPYYLTLVALAAPMFAMAIYAWRYNRNLSQLRNAAKAR